MRGILIDSHLSSPSGRLFRSFNWYKSRFGHLLALTGFLTRRRDGERCCEAYRFQWRGFRLLEEPNLQLSLEPGSHHLGDHSGGVRDPRYTRPRDSR
jgi:hypothetical protein